jgi:hypothetical protein
LIMCPPRKYCSLKNSGCYFTPEVGKIDEAEKPPGIRIRISEKNYY